MDAKENNQSFDPHHQFLLSKFSLNIDNHQVVWPYLGIIQS